jgi:cobalt-zinc-cadmium efflux system membrane fusion protein
MTKIMWLGCVVALAIAVGCRQSPEPEAATPKPAAHDESASERPDQNAVRVSDEMLRDLRVTTSVVEEHRGAESASMLGELGVNHNAYAEVGASLQGRVVALHVTLGQRVAPGTPMATLESGALARARSDVATAQARVALSQRALERKRRLNAERIAPLREVQEAENESAAADQQWRSARATLQALGASEPIIDGNLATLVITAPISGVVIDRAVVLGQVTDPSTPLFKIANLSMLWLTVHAFERDAVRLRVGETARIAFAAMPDRTFSGQVSFIGQTVETESRTVPVRIDLANTDGQLRPGMSATAWLPVGNESGVMLTVPVAALQRVRDRWCIFVPRDGSTFEIRPIGRGRDLVGEVEVLSGVKAGETVVVDGAFLLKAETEKSAGEHEEH